MMQSKEDDYDQDEIDDAVAAIKLLPEEAKSLSAALKQVGKSKSMEDIKNSSLAALEVIKKKHLNNYHHHHQLNY